MGRHIVVSCNPQDVKYLKKIMKWGSQGKLGDDIEVLDMEDDRFYDEEGYLMDEQLAWVLKDAEMVIVIAGNDFHEHPWLDWEGEFCHQWGINRVLVRVPFSEKPLPEELKLLREIAYNPNAIEKELRDKVNKDVYY